MLFELSIEAKAELLQILKLRFENNRERHPRLSWDKVEAKLIANPDKLYSLYEMERTGGEPDVVGYEPKTTQFIFYDCSPESPLGRRNICYDPEALASRKKFKPENSALGMAQEMGVEILSEAEYRKLQELGRFDTKTSSWVKTTAEIRKLGGALFCDYRYGKVFLYHNGAESYYSSRGFRSKLLV
ncbi:MAG TPA: DUF4256 domain-containing protein [Acholeplasmataceae bacterium]|nr:DUF4256 domain-containing protein [Acholeplasmataceae bacterium]